MCAASNCEVFTGANFLRMRLVLSTVTGKPVKIKKIRPKDQNPGLNGYEANFLRLMEKMTNGSRIEVNETGTALYYQPGMLLGGELDHDCNVGRGISYYLEPLIQLAPFTKQPLKIRLKGVTNNPIDQSVDCVKASVLPILSKFLGSDDGLELKILKRGAPPGGGGEILFSCPCKLKLRPINFMDQGKVKRIRGVAYAMRVSPQFANRMVDSAKSILSKVIPDVYIYTDHARGASSGKSPAFGLCLFAETTTGVVFSTEANSKPKDAEDPVAKSVSATSATPSIPEDIGQEAACRLLDECYYGGCVDRTNQSVATLFMALGPKDVSKLKCGELTTYTMWHLRHMKTFLKLEFDVETLDRDVDDSGEELRMGKEKLMLTCRGIGFKNLSKTMT